MANENIIFATSNDTFGVAARVEENQHGSFEVIVSDIDAGRTMSVKYMYTAQRAIQLAREICV